MKIQEGRLYFIKDEFFNKYKNNYNLINNKKDNSNKRPTYFCIRDDKDIEILWFIPLSRQYEKYYKIYLEKLEKNKTKNTNYPILNFVFAENIAGTKSVFLVQNIFPTIEKYIEKEYTRREQPIIIPKKLKKEINEKVTQVLINAKRDKDYTTFTRPLELKKEVLEESGEND